MADVQRVYIGGLWKNEKDGKTYLAGTLGTARLEIWVNEQKQKENQPDYQMSIVKYPPKEKAPSNEFEDTFENTFEESKPSDFGNDDDIPF